MIFLLYLFLVILITIFHGVTAIEQGWRPLPTKYRYLTPIWYEDNISTGYICAGSVIASSYILTAGHCPRKRNQEGLTVYAGIHDMRGLLPCDDSKSCLPKLSLQGTSVRHVTNIYFPTSTLNSPQTQAFTHAPNDIAILKLNQPLNLGIFISKIALPTNGIKYNALCTCCGWGKPDDFSRKISYDPQVILGNSVVQIRRPFPSPQLQCLSMKIETNNKCVGGHRDDEFCAQSPNPDASPTPGDSGAPLICNNKIVGVMTSGNGPESSIFVDVFKHRKFITEVLAIP